MEPHLIFIHKAFLCNINEITGRKGEVIIEAI